MELPVRLRSHTAGLGRCHGILRLTPSSLVLETQLRAIVFHFIKAPVKVLHLPLEQLADLQLKTFPRCRLLLSVDRLSLLREVHADARNPLRLRLRRKDRHLARDLVQTALLRASELKLRGMDFEA